MTLAELLKGLENSSEVQAIIEKNLKESKTELLFENSEERQYVNKARLDEVIGQREKEKKSNEEALAKIKGLELEAGKATEIQAIVDSLTAEKAELEKQIQNGSKNRIIAEAMSKYERVPHNADDILSMLDMDKVVINGNEVIGLNEQLNSIVASKDYLFKPVQGGTGNTGNGGQGNDGGNGPQNEEDFVKDVLALSGNGNGENSTNENTFFN